MTERRRALIETFESRILYSADSGPAGLAAAVLVGAQQSLDATAGAVQHSAHELVFIDARVPDVQGLLDDLAAQQRAGRAIEAVVVGADQDGIAVIGATLAGRNDISAVHVIGHGSAGVAQLGATELDSESVLRRAGEIAAWGDALTADADLLLYGCDVGGDVSGRNLVSSLAQLTGADVAASDDLTGNARLGGDWTLEVSTGHIDAALALSAQEQQVWSGTLAITSNGTATSTIGTNTTSLTWSHTVAAGSNRALFVELSISTTGTFATGVTYGGVAMSLVGRSSSGTVPVEIWSLVNPTVGTANVVASFDATTAAAGGATTYNGVDQTTPVRGSFVSAYGFGTAGSVTVNSAAGDLVIDAQSWQGAPSGGAPGAGQTITWWAQNANITGGSTEEAGAASVNMSTSFSSSTNWVIGAVSLKSAAGITVTPTSGLTVTEAGGTAQFSVVLDTAPLANVTIGLTSSDTTEGTLSTSSLTFTPANWNVAQTVTVTGVDDTYIDGNIVFSAVTAPASSTDPNYNGLNASDVSLTNLDNDTVNTLVVDTTSDTIDGATSSIAALMANKGADGKISLREAITAANNTANGPGGPDRIIFGISGTGIQTITLGSLLPDITDAVSIDATTDDSFAANGNRPAIVLDGGNGVQDGLRLYAGSGGSTVRGLIIDRFTQDGIDIASSNGNTIVGNWIGLNAAGTGAAGNQQGVNIWNANNNIVGGITAADRNVLSGNSGEGVYIGTDNATSTGNQIRGNYIGTNAAGTAAVGNSNWGVLIEYGASNTVGGSSAEYGNVIAGTLNYDGIELGATASSTTVSANIIGLAADGTTVLGNAGAGLAILSADNIVGGTTAGARNVISGNANGVLVTGTSASGNLIEGNYIGTDASGSLGRGNTLDGVRIEAGATGNTVGGSGSAYRNIISGNDQNGVQVDGEASDNNIVRGNWIGINAAGTATLGNGGDGVYISLGADGTYVGGATAAEGNWIAAAQVGVEVDGATTGMNIRYNRIGTDAAGTANWGTQANGILIENSAGGAGPTDIYITYNIVAFSGQSSTNNAGIAVLGSAGANISISANSIYSNAGLGIDLGPAGVTLNDVGDADTGPNQLQNFPVLTLAKTNGTDTLSVGGTLNSTANTSFQIEVFANPTLDASGYGEGKTSLGTFIVTTDASGNVTFSNPFSAAVAVGQYITATATRYSSGTAYETSEFSRGVYAISSTQASIAVDTASDVSDGDTTSLSTLLANKGSDGLVSLREAIIAANNTANGSGPDRIYFNIPGSTLHTLSLSSALPSITDALIIDGTTQPGYAGAPMVELNGTSAGATSGLVLDTGSSGSTIRGLVINRFAVSGIKVRGNSTGNLIAGNYIGTDATGTLDFGNTKWGIDMAGAGAGNIIGGNTAALRNVIGGNDLGGVAVNGSGETGTLVQGNYIGVGADGSTALGNTGYGGILFFNGATGKIGGTGPGEGNLIANNAFGVNVSTGTATILGNSIGANATLGIDLSSDGVTANDVGDADTGPNNLQNFPVLNGAVVNGVGQVQISGTLNSTAGSYFRIEFFANAAKNSSGYGEGQRYLGYANVSTDASGNATISATLTASVAAGEFISATATRSDASFATFTDTSEFAADVTVRAVNSAPAGTDGRISVTEDTVYTFTAADFGFTDVNGDSLLRVWFDTLPGTGILRFNGNAFAPGNYVAASDIALGLLTYAPSANRSGAAAASFTFRVQDNGGTAFGGVDTDPTPNTLTIDIAAVNDAPSFNAADFLAIAAPGAGNDRGYATAIQSDGKILVAGYSSNGSNLDFLLMRYNVDGTLDTRFGGGKGFVTTSIGSGDDQAHAVSVLADGRILVAGYTANGGNDDFALARYLADGSLDTSFGGGKGFVTTDFGPGTSDQAWSMVVQADGRIVLGGSTNTDMAIARYLADGTLDTSFSGDGKQTVDVAGSSDEGFGLALQADGRIIQVGSAYVGSSQDFAVLRYNTDGSLDTSFGGGDGIVTTPIGTSYDIAHAVAVQADGKIVVGGYYGVASFNNDFAVVRYAADGSLDTTFGGGDGIATTDLGGVDGAWSIALQPDGKIVAAGGSGTSVAAVVRYNTDGSLDTSFSGDGMLTLPVNSGSYLYATSVQSDGRIVATGFTTSGSNEDVLTLRLTPAGQLDTAASPGGSSLGGSVGYTEKASATVLDSNARIYDAELSAANNFGGATLTLARSGGANGQDQFSASGTLGALTEGGSLVVGGTVIGTVTTNSGGTLLLSFNANATNALVNSAMQQIAYANSSANPPASAQIDWTFNDGNTGAQGTGGALAAIGSTTVNITAVNDPPAVTTTSGALAYTENDAPTVVDSGLTVSDVDNTSLAGATVSITAGFASGQDTLVFTSQNGITGSWNGSTGVLTLSGSATLADYQTALRSVTYVNNSDNPSTAPRSVAFIANDGSANSSVATRNIAVTAVNDPPVVTTTSGALAYTENDAPTVVDSGVTVSDVDNTSLAGATVSISAGFVSGQDTLVFTSQNGITGSWNSSTGVLTLSGNATLADYQTALRSVTYVNSSDNPSTAPRSVTFVANDGSANSLAATRSLTVTAVNDPPAVTTTSGALAYTENDAPTVVDSGVTVSDVDNTSLAGATVSISAGFASGQDTLVFTSQNGITGSWNGSTGVLTLTGSATLADYQTALRSVTYVNSSDNPSTAPRSVTFIANDGSANSSVATRNIAVTAVNDPPVVTTTGGSLAYTENDAPTAVDSGVTVSDVDNTSLAGATVSITAGFASGQDTLVFTSQNGITGSWNGSTGVLTLSGNATLADYQTALRSVTYVNSSDNPSTAPRSVTFIANDGSANSSVATRNIVVTAVNDAPVLIDTALNMTVAEDAGAPSAAAGALVSAFTGGISDVDGGALKGIAITASDETNGVWYYTLNGGTNWATVGAVNAGSSLLLAADAGTRLYFAPGANYNGSSAAALTLRAWDQSSGVAGSKVDTSSNGGITAFSAATDVVDVTVTAVNDAPVFTGLDGTPAYTENAAAVVLDANVTVSDAELSAANNFGGATLTLARSGGANGQDQFSASGTLGALTEGGSLVVGGTLIGTVTTNSGGTLLLSFNANATNALVNSAMQQIAYANSSANPPASAQIDWTFNDGNTGAQGTGGALSAIGSTTVNITAVNDPPAVTTTSGTLAYTENDAPTVVDSGVTVSDVDNTNLAGATVSISAGFASGQDTLVFTSQNGITGSWNGSTGVLTLTGSATLADYQTALRSVTYVNSSDNPSTAPRSVTFIANDGSANSSVATRNIVVTAVNDPPVLTNGGSVTVAEGSGASPFGGIATVADPDTADFDGGTLTATLTAGSESADALYLQGGGVSLAGVNVQVGGVTVGTCSGGTGGAPLSVIFNANAHLAEVQAVYGAITFATTSDTPTLGVRTISVVVTDGAGGTSNTATGTVDLNAATNDAPVFANLNGTPVFGEGRAPVVLDADVTVFDAELTHADNFGGATLTLARSGGANGQDLFSASGTLGALTEGGSLVVGGTLIGTVTTNSGGTLLLSFNANATNALVNSAMQQLAYSNSASVPGSVQLDWRFSDGNTGAQGAGGALEASGSVTVSLLAPPGITVGAVSGPTTEAGGTASFSVVLDAVPTGDVTLAVSSSNTLEGTVSTALLTFTSANWNIAQTVTITGVDDSVVDGNRAYSVVLGPASSTDAAYNGLKPADVALTNIDNDTRSTIVVTTASDTLDGDTSSLYALLQNKGSDGQISLREAIMAANATANGSGGADRIVFAIAGTGEHVIHLQAALPAITDAVILDATSDDSFAANGNRPAVVLDGGGVAGNGLELTSGASGSTLRGLVIRNFNGSGVDVQAGSDGNTIAGNYIGRLGSSGADAGAAEANTQYGVSIAGANNTVGGPAAADGNVISGNLLNGVHLAGPGATGNLIQGNRIGTDATGTAAIGNAQDGIHAQLGAASTTVADNLISGNLGDGIEIADASSANAIRGNVIGLGADGRQIGNGDNGIVFYNGVSGSTIGGTAATDRNVIAGNAGSGIVIDGESSDADTIQGNFIGVAADGATPRGNGLDGIRIINGADDALIGGTTVGAGNVIANQAGNGVTIASAASTGNAVLGNRIYASGALGIDLGGDGVSLNDVGDADSGANNLQNTPVLSSALTTGGSITFSGTLGSLAATRFRIEFFASASPNPSGYGEGQLYLGFADVLTDANGNASFNPTFNVPVPTGYVVSATATRLDAALAAVETSEFSADIFTNPPRITSHPAVSVAENSVAVTTVTATDPDGAAQTLTYSLAGGADAALFQIDAATGALSFKTAPDFEAPADADRNNLYEVIVQVADGTGAVDIQALAVTVTPVNDNAPVITSSATAHVAENTTAVLTVTATDADLPAETLTYSLAGGADAALFQIDAVTGVLSFKSAPNFEAPLDANGDNLYEVRVQVSDGTFTGTQTLAITVDNRNEMPQGSDGHIRVAEDGSRVFTLADFGFTDPLDSPPNGLAAVQIVGAPAQGALVLAGAPVAGGLWVSAGDIAAGRLVFSPVAGANGAAYAALVFRVRDDGGTQDGGVDTEAGTHTLTIDVTPINHAPVGVADTYTLREDTPLVVAGPGVLANDSDRDGDPLVAELLTGPAHGSLALAADGSFRYTPAADWSGTDSFTYRSFDGTARSAPVTVSLVVQAVNDAPVMTRANIEVVQGGATSLSPNAIAATDVDSDLSAIRFLIDHVDNGHFELSSAPGVAIGQFDYVDLAAGKVVFIYQGGDALPLIVLRACDGQASSPALTASVSFAPSGSLPPVVPPVVAPSLPAVATPAALPPAASLNPPASEVAVTARPAAKPAATIDPTDATAERRAPSSGGMAEAPAVPQFASANGEGERVRRYGVNIGLVRFDRAQITLSLGAGAEGPLMEFMLSGQDVRGAAASSAARLAAAERPKIPPLADGAYADVHIALQAVELSGIALSVGAVWWATRAGGLVASLLMAAPAWRTFDPLPVLGPRDEEDWGDEMDDEMVRDEAGAADVFDAEKRHVP